MRKVTGILITLLVACLLLSGCSSGGNMQFSFQPEAVDHIEVFQFIVPTAAEKKLASDPGDIQAIMDAVSSMQIDGTVASGSGTSGGTVLSLRFYLKDGTQYEMVYEAYSHLHGVLTLPGQPGMQVQGQSLGQLWQLLSSPPTPAAESELPVLH